MTALEIDALCAEKVLGWHSGDGLGSAWFDDSGTFQGWKGGRLFSTDPVASKQLRDKMRADGWNWILIDRLTTQNTAEYIAVIYKGEISRYALADTEEIALALAALKTVGVNL